MVGTFAVMATKKFKRVYLKEWREYAEQTQKQLAAELGVAEGTVSRWETGDRKMDVDDLVSIATILAKKLRMPVDPQDLFRHPKTLSFDSMMRNVPEAKKREYEAVLKALNTANSGKDAPNE